MKKSDIRNLVRESLLEYVLPEYQYKPRLLNEATDRFHSMTEVFNEIERRLREGGYEYNPDDLFQLGVGGNMRAFDRRMGMNDYDTRKDIIPVTKKNGKKSNYFISIIRMENNGEVANYELNMYDAGANRRDFVQEKVNNINSKLNAVKAARRKDPTLKTPSPKVIRSKKEKEKDPRKIRKHDKF